MPHKDAAGRWISDDGLYVWNGGAWVPHSAPPTIAPPDEQQVEAQTDEVRGQAKQPESLIVPWALGTMTLESNALVLGMNIQEGIFRKKRSHVERRIPLGDIQAVRARESDKALEVVFRDGTFEGFQGCESLELLSRFLEGLPDSINV